jgi:hypothetical protein
VIRFDPFQSTAELLMNPLPFTISVKPAPPAAAFDGDKLLIDGAGLLAWLMVKLDAPDVPPPGVGLTTVTWAVPAELMSEAVMLACNCVEFT